MTPVKVGGVYYAFWTCVPGCCDKHTVKTRHKASLQTSDKREAKALIADLERELDDKRARKRLGLPEKYNPAPVLLEDFKEQYLESVHYDKAESTLKTEACHLNTLSAWLGEGYAVAEITHETLERYKRTRLKTIAPRSWNSELATLKSIFAWGLRQRPPFYQVNPFAEITRVPKGEPTIEKYVKHGDLVKVVASCNDPFWTNLLAFLYATWCRGGEVRNLKWKDVHEEEGYIAFLKPKEKKPKTVALTPELRKIITKAKELAGESVYVFPGRFGLVMSKDSLHHRLSKRGKSAGVKLSPHMLRHSGITDALRRGAPVFSVQSVAGHTQVSTTQGYHHSDFDAQRDAMGKLDIAGLIPATNLLLPP